MFRIQFNECVLEFTVQKKEMSTLITISEVNILEKCITMTEIVSIYITHNISDLLSSERISIKNPVNLILYYLYFLCQQQACFSFRRL